MEIHLTKNEGKAVTRHHSRYVNSKNPEDRLVNVKNDYNSLYPGKLWTVYLVLPQFYHL